MSDVSGRRKAKAFVLAVAVSVPILIGIAVGITGWGGTHQVPHQGKFGGIIWIVAELFWHPVIGIPVLAVLVIGVVYVTRAQLRWKRGRRNLD
jgi:hypothetical protein